MVAVGVSRRKEEGIVPSPNRFINSGCELLNCVLGGGWALGRISNVVGDKSSGKCVKNAYLSIPDKGLVKIDDIGKNMPETTFPYKENLGVMYSNEVTTSHFYKEKVSKTIKIKTRHGYEIEGTLDHPILIQGKENVPSFISLKDIKKGDFTIIVKGGNFFGEKQKMKPFIAERRFQSEKEVKFPEYISPEIGSALGFVVADGGFHSNTTSISNSKVWYHKKATEVFESMGLSLNKGFGVSSSILTKTLKAICGNPEHFTARFKYIPQPILSSPKDVQVAFLRALIDCDGYFSGNGLSYYTASEVLANQVHLVLLNLGIISSHRTSSNPKVNGKVYEHTYHSISIYAHDLKKYAEIVGSDRHNFSKILEKNCKRCSDFDSIPYIIDTIRNDIDLARIKVGWCRNGKMKNKEGRFPRFRHKGSINVTYQMLEQFIEAFADFGDVINLEKYRYVLEKEFHFDPIVEIIESNEPTYVYDFHVPETHLFWGNGFINHNTLLGIEASANFINQFPEGKIYYHETEAAFDEGYAESLGMPIEVVNFIKDKNTIEELFESLSKIIADEDDTPRLYIVDSLDALSDKTEMERAIDKGTYGQDKAKKMSEMFRRLAKSIEHKKMHLMIISQLRDKISIGFGEKSQRSGGRALDFYASQVVWLAETGKIKKTMDKIERVVGVHVKSKCKKNKISRPFRECEFPIIFEYGVDNIKANLDWLKEVKCTEDWEKEIKNPTVIYESKELQEKLNTYVRELWVKIEEQFTPKYSKYGGK